MRVLDRDSVTIACVSEDNERWFNRVFTLAVSLRNFGGALAGAPLRAQFVESLDGVYRLPLLSLGVETQVVPRFPDGPPQANKLRMLEGAIDDPAGGILVALDCDVVVLRDFSAALSPAVIRASAARRSPLSPQQWDELLDSLSLRRATKSYAMHLTGDQLRVPYVNSGVLFIPQAFVGSLHQAWASYVRRLARRDPSEVILPSAAGPYIDQVALACALLDTDLPIELLDLTFNFPTKPPELRSLTSTEQVKIAHYHRWVDADGLLKKPSFPGLEPDVRRLNSVLEARRRNSSGRDLIDRRPGIDELRRLGARARRAGASLTSRAASAVK